MCSLHINWKGRLLVVPAFQLYISVCQWRLLKRKYGSNLISPAFSNQSQVFQIYSSFNFWGWRTVHSMQTAYRLLKFVFKSYSMFWKWLLRFAYSETYMKLPYHHSCSSHSSLGSCSLFRFVSSRHGSLLGSWLCDVQQTSGRDNLRGTNV